MWLLLVSLALAETGDPADTAGDTGPYVDTGATATLAYTHEDVGCGGAAGLVLGALALAPAARRRPTA